MNTIPSFYFDLEYLEALASQYRESFKKGVPFPHVVIDNFLPENILNVLINEFPAPDQIEWTVWGPGLTKQTHNKYIEKIGTSDETKFRDFTRHFMSQLNSGVFLSFLEKLTPFERIIPDPTYNGCGLHSTGRGGKLMIHTDTNRHPVYEGRFHQCLNLIFFLNKDWKEEYGGHLELWNRDATQCVKKILPIANRCVIFDTGSISYHGHPHPLACPENRRRNSLALYYYVLDRCEGHYYQGIQTDVHWVPVTSQDRIYQRMEKFKNTMRRFVPPIVFDLKNRFLK